MHLLSPASSLALKYSTVVLRFLRDRIRIGLHVAEYGKECIRSPINGLLYNSPSDGSGGVPGLLTMLD